MFGIAGAISSSIQARKQNRAAERAADLAWKRNKEGATTKYNRDVEMRSTEYQVGMADMKKAGLNPILAYQQGGAGNLPSAQATAQASKVADRAHITQSALAGIQASIQAATAKASIENIRSQTNLTNLKGDAQTYENYIPGLAYEGATAIEAKLRGLASSAGLSAITTAKGAQKHNTPYSGLSRLKRNFDTEKESWKKRSHNSSKKALKPLPILYNPYKSGGSGGTYRSNP